MTQLMLFDAPASITSPTVAFTPAVAVRSEPKTTSSFEEPKQGLNHMGDLARLVLMRYDMVARRRAERAQKARRAATA